MHLNQELEASSIKLIPYSEEFQTLKIHENFTPAIIHVHYYSIGCNRSGK